MVTDGVSHTPLMNDNFEEVTGAFIIEISRTKNKVHILAVKIPEHFVASVLSGKRPVLLIGTHPKSKMQVIDLTEKQAKKLLTECGSDFKVLIDLLQICHGRIQIKDLTKILKFGLNGLSSDSNFVKKPPKHRQS